MNHGEKNGRAKLTNRQVKAIRSAWKTPQKELAREYNVSPSTISRIVTGQRYRHHHADTNNRCLAERPDGKEFCCYE